MKFYPTLIIAFIITSCAPPKDPIKDSSWLQGTWEREFNGNTQIESWNLINDTLFGKSSFANGNDTTIMIHHTIMKHNDEWVLITQDQGVEIESTYSLIPNSGDSLEFNNPHNEWPTNIVYKKTNEKILEVKLNGYYSGLNKSIVFKYKKK